MLPLSNERELTVSSLFFDLQAIPDVSAQADYFRIYFRGKSAGIGGTSASSPTVAGLVALLNDARLAAGKPSLGFLNPLIYALNGNGFHDIAVGNAPGCGTPGFNVSALVYLCVTHELDVVMIGDGWVGPCYRIWDA
jgi:subtilase family serine protease